ncbi:uncharacterized protein PFL1_02666 [Pseudozyma flocculosa PF-1]|uniref:Mid2 domain-containing protein n=2 Tax=Pseudozyma flocculosa TaxID=84751 RepID=A0A5C3EZQ5_9BASI|nr:uncharacterized protein PFL1_02666 [Pseudozyma flocculosa PF-1]EPQ29993.1 hypothetical protein PFL1_02666 [Pseudozyma flocculosa PF-1]SPO37310.1 uncharacterized protein PSFLO_02783 [Pseudozyma flocculosa]
MLPTRLSLAALLAATFGCVGAVNLTIPALAQCEPATFQIEAKGNVTIGAKDASRMSNVMRAFVPVMGTVSWTWDIVELPENETAIFIVTDFFGSSPFDIAQHFATAVVGASPTNNSACLPMRFKHTPQDLPRRHQRSIEVPVIVGVLIGFVGLLVGLVVLVMLRRRRERRMAEKNPDANGDPQDEARRLVPPDYTPAGGGYMAKLVPGLQMAAPPPPPAAPSTAGSRTRSGRRRNFRTWRRTDEDDLDGDLPSYGESQNHSRVIPPGYAGSLVAAAGAGSAVGQSFELRERVPSLRLQTIPLTPATEVPDHGDDGDGWGGRNSIFGPGSIGSVRPAQPGGGADLQHGHGHGHGGGGSSSIGASSLGGGSRSIVTSSTDRIELFHHHGDRDADEDEPITSPLLPKHADGTNPFGR